MIKIVSEDSNNSKNNEPQRGLLLDSKPKTKSGSILSNTAQAATLPMTARMKKKVQ